MQLPEGRSELIDGELVVIGPQGGITGMVAATASYLVGSFVKAERLGVMLAGEPGFILHRNPDRVRCPYVAFLRADRFPNGPRPKGFIEGAPDLAVKIASALDPGASSIEKTNEWLATGAQAVWVLFAETTTVMVHRPEREVVLLRASDVLSGDPVIPGFSVPVQDLFD